MAMKLTLALLPLIVAGCVSAPPVQPPAERPSFLYFQPGKDAGVRLSAPFGGVFAQSGPCLGLVKDGFFSTVIWPETARISYDRRGLLLRDLRSGVSARLGDRIEGSGGPLPPGVHFELGPPVLNYVMRIECARRPIPKDPAWTGPGWIAIVNPGFRVAPALKAPAP
jgi:hypothetical protein